MEAMTPDAIGQLLEAAREKAAVEGLPTRQRLVNPKHEMLYAMLATNVPIEKAAEVAGVGVEYAKQLKRSPEGQSKIAAYLTEIVRESTGDVGRVIRASAMESVQTILDVMRTSKKDELRLKAAIEMKDTAGFRPRETVFTATYNITDEVANRIREGLRESFGGYEELPPVEDSTLALIAQAEEDSVAPESKKEPPLGRRVG